MLKQTLTENVISGYYNKHEQGVHLFTLDLNEILESHDEANEALRDENKGLVADNAKLAEEKKDLEEQVELLSTQLESCMQGDN